MTLQPTSQVTNSNSKATSTASPSKQQANDRKGDPQIQEEWGEEDGEFELEEDDTAQAEQSIGEKPGSSESIEYNVEDDQKDEDEDNTYLSQRQSSINYHSLQKKGNDKSPSKTSSTSSSPQSQDFDVQDHSSKTKSGRKILKPNLFTPETKKLSDTKKRSSKTPGRRQRRLSSVSHNVSSQQSTFSSASSPKESPNSEVTVKIEESDQAVDDDTVCILCHDGNSPKQNRIVLCDKCDTPYHQRCHKPFIEDRVVEIPDAEWICSRCDDDLRGRKRRRVETGGITSVSTVRGSSSRSYSSEISGDGLTEDQKIAYLSSLPQRVLIDLILIAEKLHPDLPLYPADVKEKVADNAYASDRGNDSRVLDTSTSLPHQSFMSHASTLSQPPQNYTSSSINNNLSRAHLPAVGIDLPSYEEMIVQALASIADPAGSAPRNIFDWMNSTYPLHKNFRASASQALQKAVKKGRVFRIGTVYKINPNYRPAKRTRRFFKKPSSNEPSAYKDDDDDNGDDVLETDSHSCHDGAYEISVKLDDNDNITSVHSLDIEEHPSLTSSAVSSPLPNAVSNGHTAVTSPEANSPLDDIPNKVVSVMINEPSTSMCSIVPNQTILSPVMNTSVINNQTDLSSTLLHPPVQQTLPSLSSVSFFGSSYGENKQNSIFYPSSQTGNYDMGLSSMHNISYQNVQGTGNPSSSAHLK